MIGKATNQIVFSIGQPFKKLFVSKIAILNIFSEL